MKTPEYEEVEQKYKDAVVVKCAQSGEEVNVTEHIIVPLHLFWNSWWIDFDEEFISEGSVCLWNEYDGYAEIINKKSLS